MLASEILDTCCRARQCSSGMEYDFRKLTKPEIDKARSTDYLVPNRQSLTRA